MKYLIHKKTDDTKKGFTLVETLMAISILMIAVIVPLSIVANALQASYFARDQITAAYLAQDVIEYVRSLRDGDAITSVKTTSPQNSWASALTACAGANGCDIDTINGNVASWSAPLKYDESSGFYHSSSGSGDASRFARKVKISGNAPEYKVDVEVTWTGSIASNGNSKIQVSESLFNVWQ
ncbi:MAG: prepilin-type N-terminal cleavage/methylation domain-containing protein [Candidatus Pacebacteria bacterium]|nr:prepilin-type N-terminal cleavage/methylation domain-containing protein [Candidatus Paceibacterota bacterium]